MTRLTRETTSPADLWPRLTSFSSHSRNSSSSRSLAGVWNKTSCADASMLWILSTRQSDVKSLTSTFPPLPPGTGRT